jgi:HAD superfamily hydrolase (TIGR01549 family)
MRCSKKSAGDTAWHEFPHLAFDIEGTLLNSNIAHVWAWQDAIQDERLELPFLTLFLQQGLAGRHIADKFSFALRDRETALRIAQRARQIYAEKYIELVTPYAEGRKLLEQLQARGRKLYALTSSSRLESDAEAMLKRFGLEKFFDAVLTAEESEDGKPNPEPFSTLREIIGSRQSLIALGDSPYDFKAATAAGVPFVFVGHGGFPREWFTKAHSVFFNCLELLQTLPRLNARLRKSA